MAPTDTPRIVVGIDGSEHSRAALDVAVDEARRRGAGLDVIHAWTTPLVFAGMDAAPPPRSEWRAAAHELLDQVLGPVPDDVKVVRRVVEGSVAATLIEASRDADLLVVGSRGRGGFAGLLLGSTSHQVTAHAACPVLVVPTAARPPRSRLRGRDRAAA